MQLEENLLRLSTAPVAGKGTVLMIYMNKIRQLCNCQNYAGLNAEKKF